MKYLSVVAIAFFLLGCQTVGAVSGNIKLIKEEEEVEGLRTAKPIACVSNVKLLDHLKSIGEVPYAVWFDENLGHPVIMLSNMETGSLTVLEYPSQGKIAAPMYDGLACVLSSGVGLISKPPKKINIKKIKIILKR